jgi:hypothetical protein
MNNAEDRFRQLLADAPFDDSYRQAHRDEVRERALLAFDETVAARIPSTLDVDGRSQGSFTRRHVARLGWAAAIAATLIGVLAAWYGRADRSLLIKDSPNELAAAQVEARALADQKLIASLKRLNDFEDDQLAAAFDLGVEACLSEHGDQIAWASERSLDTLRQPN